jgi:hypothetical protein
MTAAASSPTSIAPALGLGMPLMAQVADVFEQLRRGRTRPGPVVLMQFTLETSRRQAHEAEDTGTADR